MSVLGGDKKEWINQLMLVRSLLDWISNLVPQLRALPSRTHVGQKDFFFHLARRMHRQLM